MKIIPLISSLLSGMLCLAQSQEDSIQLAGYFNQALQKPDSGNLYLEKAAYLFKSKLHVSSWEDTYRYHLSRFYILKGALKSADSVLQQAISGKHQADPDQAKFYSLLGSVAALEKKNDEAVSWYRKTLVLLEKKGDRVQAAYIRSNIANIFFSSLDYRGAYTYLRQAYNVTHAVKDTLYGPSIEGMYAITLLKIGSKDSAFYHARNALANAEKYKNPQGLVVANYILGECYLDRGQTETARATFQKSKELAGQTGQYYYVMLADIGLMLAALQEENFSEAVTLGEEAAHYAQLLQNNNTAYSIAKNLSKAYAGLGNYEKAYRLMQTAHRSYQRNTEERREKRMRELLVKYETEKKEKEIARKELQLSKSETRMAWLVMLIVCVLIVFSWMIVRNRQRLKRLHEQREYQLQQALVEGEEMERKRLSEDIHDGLASAIAGIRFKLENEQGDQAVIGELNSLQQEARRMAHNLMPLHFENSSWLTALQLFCERNSVGDFRIFFTGNVQVKIPDRQARVLYRIIQELIQNVMKHAKASYCDVSVLETSGVLEILVADDGIGFDSGEQTGQGLQSIRKRLEAFGSVPEIESEPGKGTVIRFVIDQKQWQ